MSDPQDSVSEEDLGTVLTAYLDGELPASKVREVEELLTLHEPARRLLAELEALTPALPNLYQSVLTEPVPDHLVATIESHSDAETESETSAPADGGADRGQVVPFPAKPERRSVLTRIAASIALVAAGGAGGYLARDTLVPAPPAAKPSWIDQVAEYHSVYGREQRHLVEVPADEIDHIRAWLGKRLNRENLVADLTPLGLDFEGARLLVINGKHVAQLMYRAEGERPVGFCIINSPKEDAPLVAHTRDDLNLVTWRRDGFGFIVVGWNDPQEIKSIAEAVASQMESA